MVMATKCVTLMPGASLGDVRAYMSSTKGTIFHAELGLTQDFLDSSLEPGFASRTTEWLATTEAGNFHTNSGLFSIAWNAHSWSLFYQDSAGALREYLWNNGTMERTGFRQGGVLPGTSIAAATGLADGRSPLIFYQNTAGDICASPITKDRRNHDAYAADTPDVVRRGVRHHTAIGACVDRDQKTIRLYYQDDEGALRESKYAANDWSETKQSISDENYQIVSLAAVRDGRTGVRLYAQNEQGHIVEHKLSDGIWASHEIKTKVKPMSSANMVAIAAPYQQQDSRVGLLWIGEDHRLYIADCQVDNTWHEPKALLTFHLDTAKYGESAGITPFGGPPTSGTASALGATLDPPSTLPNTHARNGVETSIVPLATSNGGASSTEANRAVKARPGKVIKRIIAYGKGRIEGFKVVYEDGNASAWRGKSAESEETRSFDLEVDEYITHVWYLADEVTIQGLLFGTSNGRRSPWLGSNSEHGHFGLLQKKGSVLVDLEGNPLEGAGSLKAVWENFSPTGKTTEFRMRYEILYKRFVQLKLAITNLSGTSSGMQDIDTQAVAKHFRVLVQDVEILSGLEDLQARGKVFANERRKSILQEQLILCGEDLKTLLKFLNDLLAKLRPLSGELHESVETCRLDGENLSKDFRKLMDDLEKHKETLNSAVKNLKREQEVWNRLVEEARDHLTRNKHTFGEIMAAKGLQASEPEDDYNLPRWGLHPWRGKIDPKAALAHDFTLHHTISRVQNSDSQLQLHQSQVNFLQVNQALVEDLLKRLDELEISRTMQQLRDLINSLSDHDPKQSRELMEAVELLQTLRQGMDALEKAAAAKLACDFAKPIYNTLDALLKRRSFTWGEVNSKVLLDVSKELSE